MQLSAGVRATARLALRRAAPQHLAPALAARPPMPAAAAPRRGHCEGGIKPDAKKVTVTFVDKKGAATTVTGLEGQNLVSLAHANGIELEGACECSLACSTCHVILEPKPYDALEPPGEEEEDLLDLAFGLTATSRLGCQVKLCAELEGAKVQLPAATRNFYVDGHAPKPH